MHVNKMSQFNRRYCYYL